jgi:hypothetical protein
MKKLLIILTVIGFTVKGQDDRSSSDAKKLVVFGLKGGFNYSKVYDTQGEGFVASPKLGAVAGAWVSLPINRLLGVQPELLISQKGFKANGVMLGEPYVMTRTTTHLDVPLQLQFKALPFLSLVAGIQYSFLLSKTDKFTFGLNSTQQKEEFANSTLRKNVLGGIGGVDLNFGHFVVSARAALDLQDNHGDGSNTVPRYKNVWYQFTAGYRFY